jgi:hypothetical protein
VFAVDHNAASHISLPGSANLPFPYASLNPCTTCGRESKVPGPATTVATFDVDRQNSSALAIKARFPNIAFQTTMLTEIRVAVREASIYLAFKVIFYFSQVIGHELHTLSTFISGFRQLLWNATVMPISYFAGRIFHMESS